MNFASFFFGKRLWHWMSRMQIKLRVVKAAPENGNVWTWQTLVFDENEILMLRSMPNTKRLWVLSCISPKDILLERRKQHSLIHHQRAPSKLSTWAFHHVELRDNRGLKAWMWSSRTKNFGQSLWWHSCQRTFCASKTFPLVPRSTTRFDTESTNTTLL